MLAYRHAFHAGNHADVLKHTVLLAVLRYMNRKDKSYRFVDTHAGAGAYSLGDEMARKTGEYLDGVGVLWDREDAPEAVAAYLRAVKAFNGPGAPRRYPGSPALARMMLRDHDELRLFEKHPADREILDGHFGGAPGVEIFTADGFAGLTRQLPPPGRRGAALIDPSYEGREDYYATVRAVREGLAKLPDAPTLVWYPQLDNKPESARLPDELEELAPRKGWLHARLTVGEPGADGFGMYGSGMFVLNAPHTLREELEPVMGYLVTHLGRSPKAGFLLESGS